MYFAHAVLLSITEDATTTSSTSSHHHHHHHHVRDDRPGGAWVPSAATPIKRQKSQSRREPQVQLQTPTARCELHHLDNTNEQILVLEPTFSQVLVAVVDDAGGWMIQDLSVVASGSGRQQQQQSGGDIYALPQKDTKRSDKTTTSKLWSPLIGKFFWQNTDDDTSPWQIAQETVNAAIGILDEPNDNDKNENSQQQLALDDDGLPDGRSAIPSSKEEFWKFLGRYRTMARHGGGFVYAYLYHGKITHQLTEATAKTNPSILRLSTDAIQNGLQNGNFVDLGAVATISLALQKYMSEKTDNNS